MTTVFDVKLLLGSNLLSKPLDISELDGFSPGEWLPRLFELGLIKDEKSLHEKVAKYYKLDYLPELEPPLNPKQSIAYRIPTEILIDSQLYPFVKNEKIYIASASPFIDQDVLNNLLAYTGKAGYELVITSPREIKNALKALYYIEFSAVAEGRIKYTNRSLSASPPVVLRLARFIVISGMFLIFGVFLLPKSFLLDVFFLINVFYIYLNGLKLRTFIKSFKVNKEVIVSPAPSAVSELQDNYLPRYTVLVPLRFETDILEKLVNNLEHIDYPKSKLEIMFLVGVDDQETISGLLALGIDSPDKVATLNHMTIVRIPKAQVDTKPLVCNYGLRFATGDYTVIFDAEDKPQTDQLKKAVLGFQESSLDTVCLQGKLNFYNSRYNLLTKFFSLEYGMWYDYFLPGLQSIGSPIPLGGTSNHFVTRSLRQAGAWDPYNVTEDADLGMRIYRSNYRTRILDTYTYEEATSSVMAWLKQRARWEKGFLATLMVHLRHPLQLYKDLGLKRFIYGVTIFFGNFYMPFINPLLWVITVLYLLGLFSLGHMPTFIWVPAVFNLIIGNLIHIFMHFMAAIKLKRPDLAPLALVMPLYWMLVSIATYMASWEVLVKPYQWVKTPHGKH